MLFRFFWIMCSFLNTFQSNSYFLTTRTISKLFALYFLPLEIYFVPHNKLPYFAMVCLVLIILTHQGFNQNYPNSNIHIRYLKSSQHGTFCSSSSKGALLSLQIWSHISHLFLMAIKKPHKSNNCLRSAISKLSTVPKQGFIWAQKSVAKRGLLLIWIMGKKDFNHTIPKIAISPIFHG